MDLRGASCSMGPVTASPMGFGIPQDLIIKTEVTSPVPSPAPSPEQSSVEQNPDLSGMCAGKPLQHKMFENKDELTRALGVLTQDEKDFLGQVYYFAKDFKSRRVKLNFTQHDVGAAMGKRYGKEFSQTTISRFEALNLSFKLMQRLTPWMTEWLIETETAIAQGATVDQLVAREYEQPNPPAVNFVSSPCPSPKKRRRRTNLDVSQRTTLEAYFAMEPRPNKVKVNEIANLLQLDRDVVRVWFCNMRQRERRSQVPRSEDPMFDTLRNIARGDFEAF